MLRRGCCADLDCPPTEPGLSTDCALRWTLNSVPQYACPLRGRRVTRNGRWESLLTEKSASPSGQVDHATLR